MTNKKICVLAGSQHQFRDWLTENKLTEHDAAFVNSPEQIMGMEFRRIETVGTFWQRQDAGDLLQLAKTRVR